MMAIANEKQRVVIDEILNLLHNSDESTSVCRAYFIDGPGWKNVCVSMFNPELY